MSETQLENKTNPRTHTPEPWSVCGIGPYSAELMKLIGTQGSEPSYCPCERISSQYGLIANLFHADDKDDEGQELTFPHEVREANAARIVACVNACAGINPEAVPDLLAAAEGWVISADAAYKDGSATTFRSAWAQNNKALRAAIAKAREATRNE